MPTLPGVVKAPLLSDSVTVVVPADALFNAAVQFALCPLLSVPGEHVSDDRAATEFKLMLAVRVTPLAEAVIIPL